MKKRVLVTVMTYPALSKNHFETVCTAGFLEDGSWIRIFPVNLRLLPSENFELLYHKWQWIEVDLEQNLLHDDRPESFHIYDISSLKTLERLDFKKTNWSLRLGWVKKNKPIFTNMTDLLELTTRNEVSLAVLKPTIIKNVQVERIEIGDEYLNKLESIRKKYELDQAQLSIFGEPTIRRNFIFAEKIPFRFRYVFETEDGKERRLTIEDWEIFELYQKKKKKYDEETSCAKVKDKYLGMATDRDIYFFLGTSFEWQKKGSADPYMIIGVFAPPKGTAVQLSLF